MTKQRFDIAVIGSGPGGYPAAIKAAQLGKKVALIEAKELGGTCLNRGCIPSKTLIANAHILEAIQHAQDYGIEVSGYSIDYSKMIDRKDKVVTKVRKGLEGLIKANNIALFKGFATFLSPFELMIKSDQLEEVLVADKIIIATGSEPREISTLPYDGKKVLDSTAILNLRKLPASLAIIGGGVIGCEFASLFNAFGTEVTIIEMQPRIIPMECPSISEELKKAFTARGIKIITDAYVETIDREGDGVCLKIGNGDSLKAEIALVAIGRKMNTDAIALERAGVFVDPKTQLVVVDEHMQTGVEGIYAIGDISSTWWLAHVASHQGIVAARHASGETTAKMHYNAIPSVIFTTPEVATVGLSLEEALKQGYKATLGAFPFHALGKSQAALQTEGFAQIVTDKTTGQLLGAQVVGHEASTLVAEMAVAIANELTVECLTETIHAHPTVAEAWMEAALAANETPLHLPPKRKR